MREDFLFFNLGAGRCLYRFGGDDMNHSKAEAILQAIRDAEVGSDITILNEDMSIFCILKVKCKEHPENVDHN